MTGAEQTDAESASALVRDAGDGDLKAIQAIYAHHVLIGVASFEEKPPDTDEIARRRASVIALGLPYLVVERTGRVSGFAYAGPFRPRPAYRHTVENSVYVAPDAAGHGLGRLLLGVLIERCSAQGYRQMVAVIGDSANSASIAFHAAMGFRQVGVFSSTGFKFGRWVDTVLMQRSLGEGDATHPTLRRSGEPDPKRGP
jgi:phosphinothricin acetyltransferase